MNDKQSASSFSTAASASASASLLLPATALILLLMAILNEKEVKENTVEMTRNSFDCATWVVTPAQSQMVSMIFKHKSKSKQNSFMETGRKQQQQVSRWVMVQVLRRCQSLTHLQLPDRHFHQMEASHQILSGKKLNKRSINTLCQTRQFGLTCSRGWMRWLPTKLQD